VIERKVGQISETQKTKRELNGDIKRRSTEFEPGLGPAGAFVTPLIAQTGQSDAPAQSRD
jgi:hypothetical protein